jgi:hypothetical protein
MAQTADAQAVLTFLEYQALFREPIFEAWGQPNALMRAVFRAFRPWNINLTSISAKQSPANAGEVGIVFNLLNGKFVFSVGVGAANLLVTNPSWADSELITQVLRAGVEAVRESAKAEVDRHVLSLSMHLRPRQKQIREITSQFVKISKPRVADAKIKALGFSLYTDDGSWIVDSSVIYNDALFVKLSQAFAPSVSFEEMATSLRQEQSDLLAILQLRLDSNG